MKDRPRTILVIDDDSQHLGATQAILHAEGYRVLTHQGPFGATALVAAHKPDLVLVDVNMPGLAGDALAGTMRVNPLTAAAPVVFYSSNDEDALRRLARAHDARGYICKGDTRELRRKVAAFLS